MCSHRKDLLLTGPQLFYPRVDADFLLNEVVLELREGLKIDRKGNDGGGFLQREDHALEDVLGTVVVVYNYAAIELFCVGERYLLVDFIVTEARSTMAHEDTACDLRGSMEPSVFKVVL